MFDFQTQFKTNFDSTSKRKSRINSEFNLMIVDFTENSFNNQQRNQFKTNFDRLIQLNTLDYSTHHYSLFDTSLFYRATYFNTKLQFKRDFILTPSNVLISMMKMPVLNCINIFYQFHNYVIVLFSNSSTS